MSDSLPLEIQLEIIKKLPVKSLILLRSVSKTWNSLITNSRFIADYSGQPTQMHHLLVAYEEDSGKKKYVSIADDGTFPHQKASMAIPELVNRLLCPRMIGSSHGLFCFYGIYPRAKTHMAVLCNLSIRKAVAVAVPNVADGMIYQTILGFGVCCGSMDPKIVKISYVRRKENMESVSCIPWQVEVFTLSTGVWRSPYSGNLPRKSIQFEKNNMVVIDGMLYWLATDGIAMDGGVMSGYNLIISFDMTSEEFREVNLQDGLHRFGVGLSISKLRESLVVVERIAGAINVFGVWMMQDDVPKSFTKLFTIDVNVSTLHALVRGFRKSGELIIELLDFCSWSSKLAIYAPYPKRIDTIGIDESRGSFSVYQYMETLLLIDQPNLIAYNEN